MACVVVPTAEALVTTIVKKNKKLNKKYADNPFFKRLDWLNNMLWGGSALLAFEHIWHGEITPWFPFLTNAKTPVSASEMLFEMATSGVGMSILVTGIWVGMVVMVRALEKKPVGFRGINK